MAEPSDYTASESEMSEQEWIDLIKEGDDDKEFAALAEAMKQHYLACGSPQPIPDDLWRRLALIALDF